MDGELGRVTLEIRRVYLLDRLTGAQMRSLLARQAELLVQGLAYQGVAECIRRLRARTHFDDDLRSKRFLNRRQDGVVVEPSHRPERREIEVTPENGCLR